MSFARNVARALAFAQSILIMAITNNSAATVHQRIEVYRFNEKLDHAPPYMWNIEEGPPLSPVYVVAGSGDILAMVRPTNGAPLVLKRWTTEGRLISSRALGITEDVIASSLSTEATLTIVTHSELIQVSVPREEPPLRLALPDGVKASKNVVAGPHGAWFELKDRLVHVGFDGHNAAIKLPVFEVAPQFARCRPDQTEQFPCEYVGERSLHATIDGGCIVIESVVHDFRVPNSYHIDHAGTYVLSALSSTGKLRAQSARGEVKSKWEWFWSESRGSKNSPDFGLVRTRHEGTEGMTHVAERSNGDLLLFTVEPNAIWRLDRSLRKSWKESAPEISSDDVVSPPWSRGILATLGGSSFFVVDDNGSHLRKATYFDAAAMDRPPGVATKIAVGQSRNGEWLIVNY
jgi:hypothetical protein